MPKRFAFWNRRKGKSSRSKPPAEVVRKEVRRSPEARAGGAGGGATGGVGVADPAAVAPGPDETSAVTRRAAFTSSFAARAWGVSRARLPRSSFSRPLTRPQIGSSPPPSRRSHISGGAAIT